MNNTKRELEEIEEAHDGWVCWVGVSGDVYTRRLKSSPPVVYRANTPAELEACIIQHEARQR